VSIRRPGSQASKVARGSVPRRTPEGTEYRRGALLRDEGGTLGRLLCAGLATPEAQGRPDSVRFGSGNPHGLPVNAGYCGGPARVRKTACLRVIRCGAGGAGTACHAEGRGFESHQPLQRRPAFCGSFWIRRSGCAFASPDNEWTIAADRPGHRSREGACLQAILDVRAVNLFCDRQKVEVGFTWGLRARHGPGHGAAVTGEQV
jgi:hypothetical protein